MNKITITAEDAINRIANAPNRPTRCLHCGREMDPKHQPYGAGPVCRKRIGTLRVLQIAMGRVLGLDVIVTHQPIVPAVLPQLA